MESIVLVLAMLLAVVASGYLARILPVPVPLPLVQIALGAMIAGGFKSGIKLDPEVFFLLFLPPLLFIDGWRIPNYGLLRDKGTILELALGLVIFTVVGMGFLIHWMIPAMPLAVAFALAAIVSPTDALAVSSIAARTPLPRRLLHILQGESLLNDASGLVCFRFAVAAAMTGTFSLGTASLTFLWMFLAGVAIGVAFTLGVTMAQMALSGRIGEETGTPILVNLLLPFGAYLLAEQLGASGILAAVAAGVTMSYVELTGRAPPATRVDRAAVWDTAQFALNGIVFVLLGEQLPGILRGAVTSVGQSGQVNPWWLAVYAAGDHRRAGTAALRLGHGVASHHPLRGAPARRAGGDAALAAGGGGHARGRARRDHAGRRDEPAAAAAGRLAFPGAGAGGVPGDGGDPAVDAGGEHRAAARAEGAGASRRAGGDAGRGTRPRDAAHAAIAAVEIGVHDPSVMPADADAHGSAAARVIARYQRRIDGGVPAGATAEQRRKANRRSRRCCSPACTRNARRSSGWRGNRASPTRPRGSSCARWISSRRGTARHESSMNQVPCRGATTWRASRPRMSSAHSPSRCAPHRPRRHQGATPCPLPAFPKSSPGARRVSTMPAGTPVARCAARSVNAAAATTCAFAATLALAAPPAPVEHVGINAERGDPARWYVPADTPRRLYDTQVKEAGAARASN